MSSNILSIPLLEEARRCDCEKEHDLPWKKIIGLLIYRYLYHVKKSLHRNS